MNDTLSPLNDRLKLLRDPLNLLAGAFLLVWGSIALFGRPIGDFGVETDFYGDFAHYARQWSSGRPTLMNGFRGPVYYLVLAGLDLLHIDLFAAAKALSVLSSAAALRLSGGLLRRFFGGPAGLAGAIVIAANPVTTDYSYRACSDLFFFALFVGSLFLLFRKDDPDPADWAVAGGLAAGAYLTRYNGLFLVPAAAMTGLIRFGPRRGFAAAIAAYGAAFAVVSIPWWLFTWSRTGDPFWNSSFQNVAITILSDSPERAQSGGFMGSTGLMSLKDVWDVSPGMFLAGMVRNALDHFLRDVMELAGPIWAGAALLGLGLNIRAWLRRDTMAFAACGAVTYLSLLPVFYNPRFMLALILWWAAAACGIVGRLSEARGLRRNGHPAGSEASARPEERGGRRKARRGDASRKPGASSSSVRRAMGSPPFGIAVPALAALFLFLAAGSAMTARSFGKARDQSINGSIPTEILALVKEVRRLGIPIGPDTPISARKPHIGYYLNAPVVPIVLGKTADMRAAGAHYLLVSGIEVSLYPSLQSMWAPRGPADIGIGFELVAAGRNVLANGRERRATLYAIENPVPYVPAATNPVPESEAPPPGLSRIDYLRLRIARWYLRWDAEISPAKMLKLMEPAAMDHPDVLSVRADLAIHDRNFDQAEELCNRILKAHPDDERALYCLAGISLLKNDEAGFEERLYRTVINRAEPLEPSHFHDRSAAYVREMDYIPALAPVTFMLRARPDSRWALMTMAYIQQALHQYPEELATLETFLKYYPNDPEAMAMIESMKGEGR